MGCSAAGKFQDARQAAGGVSREVSRPDGRDWDVRAANVEILWIAHFTTHDLSP